MAVTKLLRRINTRLSADPRTIPDEEEPLSPGSRVFHAPQLGCCILSIVGCKTKIDVKVVKEGLKHTAIKHPRFSSKLVFEGNEPIGWIRTKVIVDDQVIVPDLDPNMDSGDEFLDDYVTNLTTTPMDISKPLWEIHLLNVKTTDANSIAVFRFHHSMGDGVSIMSLVLACTRQTANPEALPTLPTSKNKKWLKRPRSSLAFINFFIVLIFIIKLLWNTVLDLFMFLATTIWLKDTHTPLKSAPGTEKAPKRIVYRTFSLGDIKLLKNSMSVTINDVLMGITQAGLTHYLNRKYGEAKGKGNAQGTNLPKHIRIRSTLFLNLRQTSTIEEIAENMASETKKGWKWGNAIAYVMLPFHIRLRDDPLDYIRDAKLTIDRKKQSLEALCTYAAARIILKALGLKALAALTYRSFLHTTLSFSNVVGPQQEISFYGHPMAYLAPSVYGHPQALTIHFQSYLDKMTLVITVDQDVIPNPQRLCDDIEESLKLAKTAVSGDKYNQD